MPIVSSVITNLIPQADGSSLVWELHTDHTGKTYEFNYTAGVGVDTSLVMGERAVILGKEVGAREEAERLANNYSLPLTPYAFLSRFTLPERITARTLAKTDPVVEDILFMVQNAQGVYLTDASTINGVQYLQTVGVLTEIRAGEILNG